MSMLQLRYSVPGDDFTRAGEASGDVKHKLKKLGYNPSAIRRVSIAMYEGEINMVIHAGGGIAEVRVAEDKIEIDLSDHGPGIAAADLPYIFDRYYRSRSDAGKQGTGLGLSITKAIFQQHGFRFGVHSTVGKGTVFWFIMTDTEDAAAQ